MISSASRLITENRPHTGWRISSSMGISDGAIQMAEIDREREALMSRDQVASQLRYNPDTGMFTRKVRGGKHTVSSFNQKGRKRITVLGFKFLASRLAWLLYYGEWPEKTVDHINGNPADDRIANLRLASESEQQWNKGINRNNTSGVKGVSFNTRRAEAGLSPWESYITVYYKRVHLGFFAERDAAIAARCKAEMAYHNDFTRASGNGGRGLAGHNANSCVLPFWR